MNRKLHNTFSALSVATVLMTAGLIAATPAPHADPVVAGAQIAAAVAENDSVARARERRAQQVERSSRSAGEARAKAIESAALARAKDVERRAEALARQLEGNENIGEILGQVAGFTAEVATEAALNAAIEELTTIETTEPYIEPPPAPVSKRRHSRRSLAMPYFSFAPRG